MSDIAEWLQAVSVIAVPMCAAIWRSVQTGHQERRASFDKIEQTLSVMTGRQLVVEQKTADHEASDERRFTDLGKHIDRLEMRMNGRL